MAIRFACSKCGKIHRIPDHHAGRVGRCGRCGLRFVAPGAAPGPANVFVPADDDDDDLLDLQLMPGRPKAGAGPGSAILIGLVVGAAMIGGLFAFRDGIVGGVPALAPLLPPKADPPRPRVQAAPAPGAAWDGPAPEDMARVLSGVSLVMLLFVFPMVLPAVFSRRGYLSVGRWLIMAGFCFFVASFAGAMYEVGRRRNPGIDPGAMETVGSFLALPSSLGIGGCLLAAAVHPKDPPRP